MNDPTLTPKIIRTGNASGKTTDGLDDLVRQIVTPTPHDQRLHGCLRRVLEAWTIVDRSAQPPRAGRVAVDRAAFEGLQAAIQVWRCATLLYAAAEAWDLPIAPPELDLDAAAWEPYDRTPLPGDATDGLVDSLTAAAVTAAADLGSHVATIAATSTTSTKAWLPGDQVARARRLTAAWRRASVELLNHEDDEHPTAPPGAFPVEAEPDANTQASAPVAAWGVGTMCCAHPTASPMVVCQLPAGHAGRHLGVTVLAGDGHHEHGAWADGDTHASEPTDEERAIIDPGCRETHPMQPSCRCIGPAGHGGSHWGTAWTTDTGAEDVTWGGGGPLDEDAARDDQAPDDATLPPEAGDVDGGAA